MALESINPASGEVIRKFEEWPLKRTIETVEAVGLAWPGWADVPLARRAALVTEAGRVLRDEKETLARTMALEMGKPIREGRGEIEKCALVCDYYAANGERFLAPEGIDSDASNSYVAFRPLGPILAVMPWNFPFWQVFRFAAPALMAGNCGVLKHASNVPQCALSIEEIFRKAGFPEDVFRTLMIGAGQVNEVIENRHIKAVTLTGSDTAGRRVAAKAGEMLKKTVLELGGSDPFIVLADADLDESARVGALSRCLNSGQSCIAAKRMILVDAVFEPFLERLKKEMAGLVIGDPLQEGTQVGPLARRDLMEDLHSQVEMSVALGAEAVLGGAPLPGPGCFYPPTILTGVAPGMPAWSEELFGPVAALIRVKDAAEALQVANSSAFGLGGSVWTRNITQGEEMTASLRVGAAFVNGLVKSDPRLPFGGIGISGYGRELSSFGIREFVNIQTVWIK